MSMLLKLLAPWLLCNLLGTSEVAGGKLNFRSKFGEDNPTPLDEYVAADDPDYAWFDTTKVIHGANEHGTWKGHVLNMTSGSWLNSSLITPERVIWWHFVVLIIPEKMDATDKLFFWTASADPMSNTHPNEYPTFTNADIEIAGFVAAHSKLPAAVIFQNPNNPIVFADDPSQKHRSSDSLLAYSFKEAMFYPERTNVLFPMVRADVRALDTAIVYAKEKYGYEITSCAAGGASKWGWTTWLFAAVDDRIDAFVPLVFTMLDWNPNSKHQFQSYGGWTFAFKDYWECGLTAHLDDECELDLFQMIDPYMFFDRYENKPKLIVNNGRDEFFMPDDTWLWWDDLPDPKYYLLCPNADHPGIMGLGELLPAISTWAASALYGVTPPSISWTLDKDIGTITAYTKELPDSARYWHSESCKDCNNRRDWRALNLDDPCPSGLDIEGYCYNDHSFWTEEKLRYISYENGYYVWEVNMEPPKTGYRAFIMDFKYNASSFFPDMDGVGWPVDNYGVFELSTQTMIVNDIYPFPTCYNLTCNGTLV